MVRPIAACILTLIFAGFAFGCSRGDAMREEKNKSIVLSYLSAIADPGLDDWDEYFAEQVMFNGSPVSADAVKSIIEHFRLAFPDLRFIVRDQIAEGDRVATWGFFEGTHSANFNGIPATMRHVRWLGIAVDRLSNDEVVEMWHEMDTWGLMQKLREEEG
jgi:predicted ester cyclase